MSTYALGHSSQAHMHVIEEEDTCMSYEEEDKGMSYEEEDTCIHTREPSGS
jgi:hypothetical protein